jgi:hypothetical protein
MIDDCRLKKQGDLSAVPAQAGAIPTIINHQS